MTQSLVCHQFWYLSVSVTVGITSHIQPYPDANTVCKLHDAYLRIVLSNIDREWSLGPHAHDVIFCFQITVQVHYSDDLVMGAIYFRVATQ